MTTPASPRSFFLKNLDTNEQFRYAVVPDGRADHAHDQWEESLPLSQELLKPGVNVDTDVESVHEGKPIRVRVIGMSHGVVDAQSM